MTPSAPASFQNDQAALNFENAFMNPPPKIFAGSMRRTLPLSWSFCALSLSGSRLSTTTTSALMPVGGVEGDQPRDSKCNDFEIGETSWPLAVPRCQPFGKVKDSSRTSLMP